MARSDMRHTHDVIQYARYPATMGMPRWALEGLPEDHGASDAISAFLPGKRGSARVAPPGHRDQFSHDVVDAAAVRPATHVDQAGHLIQRRKLTRQRLNLLDEFAGKAWRYIRADQFFIEPPCRHSELIASLPVIGFRRAGGVSVCCCQLHISASVRSIVSHCLRSATNTSGCSSEAKWPPASC